jgi:putative flippase GtrA
MPTIHPEVAKAFRYIVSGGSAAVINLGTLYILTRWCGVWYLAASILAFVASFLVSFGLQRTWTFQISGTQAIVKHTTLYLLVALLNLALNTLIVFTLVHFAHFEPLLAQFTGGVIVALEGFFLYRSIFRS